MDENTQDFAEFAAAFGVEEDNQIPSEDAAEETGSTQNEQVGNEQEATDEPEGEETAEGNESQNAEEVGADGNGAADKGTAEQKFTIKVNKESREVNLSEMTELAQKGADYDRVKGQLTEARQESERLRGEIERNRSVLEIMEIIAEEAKIPIEQLGEQLYMNFRKSGGSSEAEAASALENAKLKRENAQLKAAKEKEASAAQNSEARAKREIEEFHREFPGVELTRELCEKLMGDVQGGTTLSNAYRKMQAAEKDAQIAELQRQLAAEKQNKKNRVSSPGSQKDSGGKRQKSEFDDFLSAFA
jgi:hypothetical protein